MSAFGNDVKDEVYSAIKELFASGYKISDLLEIVRYAVESKECEKAFDRYLKQKSNWEKEINKEALEGVKNIIENVKRYKI